MSAVIRVTVIRDPASFEQDESYLLPASTSAADLARLEDALRSMGFEVEVSEPTEICDDADDLIDQVRILRAVKS